MDSITTKSLSRFFIYKHSNTGIEFLNCNSFSFFKFNHCKKQLNRSAISTSYQTPPNPEIHKPKWNYRFPVNPFQGLIPILQSIRDSMAMWVSYVRGFVESQRESDTWDGDYLQSGGIGMALLSMTSTAKVHISPFVATLTANPTFVSGFFAWVVAQSIKVFLIFFVERKWDFRIMFSSGGMPSSHSALCTALTTSVALRHGVADSLFPVCLGFTLIVMYDAIGVRRHAGMQAEVLNKIIEDLFQGHPISQRKLKELLGHTPSQVLAGAFLGIFVAFICCQGCLVAT